MPDPKDLTVPARDGFELKATLYGPSSDIQRLVIVNSATAVPRRLYRHFGAFMAAQGWTTLTYDYRGVGQSRPKATLRGFQAKARDWVLQDMAGVLDWACASLPSQKLYLVGHSIGGQLAGLLDKPDVVDAMVTFSAQSGHWRYQGGGQKLAVALHSYATLPLLSVVCGYMPWSLVGGEDIPRGVALEWASWCRHPDYVLGDDTLPLERFADFKAPVLAYSIEDDNWGTRRSVDMMMNRAYPNVTRKHIDPAQMGIDKLGHMGVFRPHASAIWEEAAAWLEAAPNG